MTILYGDLQAHPRRSDGKRQDDATGKRAKAVADLAKIVAGEDNEMKARYGV